MELGYSASMRIFARLALLLLPLMLGGCRFENPLTTSPSEDLNTWLLGEWQLKEKGGMSTAVVAPVSGDRYSVHLSLAPKGGGGRRDYDFEAWASRVGNSVFFTLRNLKNSANLPEGAHVFLHAQMIDQGTVRLKMQPALSFGRKSAPASRMGHSILRRARKTGSVWPRFIGRKKARPVSSNPCATPCRPRPRSLDPFLPGSVRTESPLGR